MPNGASFAEGLWTLLRTVSPTVAYGAPLRGIPRGSGSVALSPPPKLGSTEETGQNDHLEAQGSRSSASVHSNQNLQSPNLPLRKNFSQTLLDTDGNLSRGKFKSTPVIIQISEINESKNHIFIINVNMAFGIMDETTTRETNT